MKYGENFLRNRIMEKHFFEIRMQIGKDIAISDRIDHLEEPPTLHRMKVFKILIKKSAYRGKS